jgi:hypothetical protein
MIYKGVSNVGRKMRFRQVHLDFHTSEAIPRIGEKFSKQQFQSALKLGHVDSVTIFAKCHHGWAYFPSEENEMHPHLQFDLLGLMIEAAHEIGVNTPVYISAGLDEKLARRHPEWLMRDEQDRTNWVDGFMKPGYHQFCLNTPYLDILIRQVEEVVRKYDADGIFLDIVGERMCYCQYCVAELLRRGQDPRNPAAVKALGVETYARYGKRVREAVDKYKRGLPVFHNNGHIRRGRRDLADLNTHLELESLPTGGWGYDHFPLSARYASTLGMEYLGMTGKFHTSWGEFGGYKHPNALRYETALSLANGARCSVGDQLHPEGVMDDATYRLIGEAYAEVERKEPWCEGAQNVADVAVLSLEAAATSEEHETAGIHTGKSDAGVVRMMLEGKYLFDVIDTEAEFTRYKIVILPDDVLIGEALKAKLEAFFASGGKVLATGRSGLNLSSDAFTLELGVRWVGSNEYRPDYYRPLEPINQLGDAAYIQYSQGQRVELDGGTELGRRENPYFNREVFTFCSHQHTPNSSQYGGPGMVESKRGIYIAWSVFEDYATKGSLALKQMVFAALDRLLQDKTLQTSLPSQGIATLTHQEELNRYVNHLLYASPVKRGDGIEVIEDILPVYEVAISLRLPEGTDAKRVYLAPQSVELPFEQVGREVRYTVPKLECHQMVVIDI